VLRLSAVQTLALNYSSRGVYLSGDSLALLLSLNQYCDLHNWQGLALDRELTQSEIDEIEALSAKAYKELMAENPLIGTIVYAARGSMDNALLCDGGTYAREDYPALYAVLASDYIVDADNFSVPNLIGNFLLGTDESGNQFGGEGTHTLTIAETPPHTHEESGHSHIESSALASVGAAITGVPVPSAVPSVANTGLAFVNLNTVGGGQAHNNMPPYTTAFAFIIYR